ncbi:MAG: hypothetical protein ABJB17_08795, partial [Burkholderiales bacterium]
ASGRGDPETKGLNATKKHDFLMVPGRCGRKTDAALTWESVATPTAFGLPHGGTHWTGFPYFQSEDTPLSSGAREALTFGNALRRCHNPTDRTVASRVVADPDSGIVPR